MGRVLHFEIHASDPDRAMSFYKELFDWRFDRYGDQDYWTADTGKGDGINGALMRRRGPAPVAGAPVMGATITTYVDDLQETLDRASGLGARPLMKTLAVPGYGWANYIHDPDNNIIGLFQPDVEAK